MPCAEKILYLVTSLIVCVLWSSYLDFTTTPSLRGVVIKVLALHLFVAGLNRCPYSQNFCHCNSFSGGQWWYVTHPCAINLVYKVCRIIFFIVVWWTRGSTGSASEILLHPIDGTVPGSHTTPWRRTGLCAGIYESSPDWVWTQDPAKQLTTAFVIVGCGVNVYY